MKRWLKIQFDPIAERELSKERKFSASSGAVIYFLGVVRGAEGGEEIKGLEYEVFREMAEHQFHKIFDEVERLWPVESVRLVHRVGSVSAGEPSLWVELMAPHRGEAFAACQYLIDEMKKKVPIWKKTIAGTDNP